MGIMLISEKDHEVEDIDNLLFVMLIDQRSTKQSGSNYSNHVKGNWHGTHWMKGLVKRERVHCEKIIMSMIFYKHV